MATLNILYGNPTKFGEFPLNVVAGQTAVVGKLVSLKLSTEEWQLDNNAAAYAAGVLYSQDLDPYTGAANTLDKCVVLIGAGTIIETDQFVSAAAVVPGAELEQGANGKWAIYAAGVKLGRVLAGGYGYATVTIITYI